MKKTVEDKFSIDMDAYFKGIKVNNNIESKEYNEIFELGKTLADKDFSKDSNKDAVLNKVLNNINEGKGERNMKKSNRFSRMGKVVASLALVGAISISLAQTSFAQGAVEKIINKINLGHIGAVQTEEPKIEKMKVPVELQGKIFDKNGKPIYVITKENAKDKMYTAKGEEIDRVSEGKIITVADEEKERKERELEIKDPNDISKYTCFNVKLPSYLPQGYKFDKATVPKESAKVQNSRYLDVTFINEKTGKKIYMQQRANGEDTKYFKGTGNKIEKIKINGVDAILDGNRNIDWETKEVLYGLSSQGNISKNDLIKIAESIK